MPFQKNFDTSGPSYVNDCLTELKFIPDCLFLVSSKMLEKFYNANDDIIIF